jgi:hypothetical protein
VIRRADHSDRVTLLAPRKKGAKSHFTGWPTVLHDIAGLVLLSLMVPPPVIDPALLAISGGPTTTMAPLAKSGNPGCSMPVSDGEPILIFSSHVLQILTLEASPPVPTIQLQDSHTQRGKGRLKGQLSYFILFYFPFRFVFRWC